MMQRRPGTSTPIEWARLRRATQRDVPLRVAEDIQTIDRWIASLPVALLPMDTPNLRMRLGTIVETHEYKKDSVILAAGRKSASRVFVIHSGTVHITAMSDHPDRSVPGLEDSVDGSHVHKLGAGSVFGLAGRCVAFVPSATTSALRSPESSQPASHRTPRSALAFSLALFSLTLRVDFAPLSGRRGRAQPWPSQRC